MLNYYWKWEQLGLNHDGWSVIKISSTRISNNQFFDQLVISNFFFNKHSSKLMMHLCFDTKKNSDWPSWKVFLFVTTNRRIFLMILQLATELVFAGSNSNCIFSPLPFLLRFFSQKTRFYNWFVMKYDSHIMIIQACTKYLGTTLNLICMQEN